MPSDRAAGPVVVERPALLAKLERAARGPVTVISAPAGSGKTLLVRAWIDSAKARGEHVGLLTVARDERDDQRFWRTARDAWAQANPNHGGLLPAVPTPDFDGRAFVDRIIAEAEEARAPVTLVVDDLHELASPAALEQLEYLIASRPPPLRLVLATRRDLRLGLHRLRLRGELTEIRAEDLTFDLEDTGRLLAAAGVVLSDAGVVLLHARAEGWAAGLRLAVNSLEGHPDPERFVAQFSGSDRTVAEYLFAEMLEAQPMDVRELLLHTSIVDRVNGSLADALVARSGSEGVLHRLHVTTGFVFPLDGERTWFRYHHLLSDLLRLELRRRAPDRVQEIHRRAAAWFEAHDQFADAIRHAQHAEDWDRAARLIADHAFGLALDGREGAVHALLAGFPALAIQRDAELAGVMAADQLTRGSLEEAERYVGLAAQLAPLVDPARRRRFAAMLAIVRLSLARKRSDFADVLDLIGAVSEPSKDDPDATAVSDDIRAVALMNLGIAEVWSLRFADGERHLREGVALARRIDRPYLEVTCLVHLAFAGHEQTFTEVRDRAEVAIRAAATHGWEDDPVIAPARAMAAGIAAWRGELDGAEEHLVHARRALRPDTEPGVGLFLHAVTGMVAASRGRFDEALAEFETSEQLHRRLTGRHALYDHTRAFRLLVEVRLGRAVAARAELEDLDAVERDVGAARLAEAAVSCADGQPEAALDRLAPVLAGEAEILHDFTTVHAHLLAAVAYDELGDRGAVARSIETALALAEPDRLVAPFAIVDVRSLLERHPRHDTAHGALLDEILDLVRGTSLSSGTPLPELAEPLTDSELRVLGYLPSNLSAREIGAELYLSVNTVKVHTRHIYAKLGVHTRTDAVARARALRLIAGSGRRRRASPGSGVPG
jgi:LuxR family maltose regulon positive regulatory protein